MHFARNSLFLQGNYKRSMIEKLKGVVLHTTPYGDGKLIVDAFTEQRGRTSLLAKRPRSRKAGAGPGTFMPLALLEMEAEVRPTRSLLEIKEARWGYPFRSLPFHPVKCALGLFLAEFLRHALREGDDSEALYAYLEAAIQWLDRAERPVANFHLVFLMKLTRFLGLLPNTEEFVRGCWFDLRAAQFVALKPLHPDALSPDEAEKMAQLVRLNFETMHLFAMNRTERGRCLEVILLYYRLHVPEFGELKSVEVLKELFD
jgi:DNA repair protein RecO (recombination protein O)